MNFVDTAILNRRHAVREFDPVFFRELYILHGQVFHSGPVARNVCRRDLKVGQCNIMQMVVRLVRLHIEIGIAFKPAVPDAITIVCVLA